ncbi:phosphatase PAP2 family protein [Fredinandcohnia humi]
MEIDKKKADQSTNVNLISFVGLLFSVGIILSILLQLKNGQVIGDDTISTTFHATENALIIGIFTFFTELGSVVGIGSLFVLSLLVIWWKYRDYPAMIVVAICVLGGDQLNKWLKEITGRERPSFDPSIYAEGFSFPSGHAMVGLTFYGFIAYYALTKLANKKAKIYIGFIFGILIFLIGFSRIVLHAHFPSDVFGGFAFGFIFLYACVQLYKILRKTLRR